MSEDWRTADREMDCMLCEDPITPGDKIEEYDYGFAHIDCVEEANQLIDEPYEPDDD